MTDWKALARAVLLAEGAITPPVTGALKRVILADGRVSKEEAEFLLDLKKNASTVCEEFSRFVHDILKRVILPDAQINAAEARWLRTVVFADGKVDEAEQRFLKELKDAALVTCPEFDELCHEYGSL